MLAYLIDYDCLDVALSRIIDFCGWDRNSFWVEVVALEADCEVRGAGS